MPTEEKTTEVSPQPELFASGGHYYIMDRRTKPQDEPSEPPAEQQLPDAPISSPHKRRSAEIPSAVAYMLLGALSAAAGAAIAVLYPLEGIPLTIGGSFPEVLADRLLQCGIFLVAEYLLGYFAAGGKLVWLIPMIYGLGAGLSAAEAIISGHPLMLLPLTICMVVICRAAARSAELSSLLLSVVSGKSGSVVTDGTAGSSYTIGFGIYLLTISAAALAEAWMAAI